MERKCIGCHVHKSIESFSKKKDGEYFKKCDKCREHQKLYNEVNKEISSIKRSKYRSENKEKVIQSNKNWLNKNSDSIKLYKREWYNKNKQKINSKCIYNSSYFKQYNVSLALYNTWYDKLNTYEECRQDPNDITLLQVKCTKCGEWFNPNNSSVQRRLKVINGTFKGDCRFYCSQECKDNCEIYKKQKYPHNKNPYSNREGSKSLRKLVLERDSHTCQKCYSKDNLECHHVIPVKVDRSLMNNPDNCITLCHSCHMEAHSDYDCTVVYLRNL